MGGSGSCSGIDTFFDQRRSRGNGGRGRRVVNGPSMPAVAVSLEQPGLEQLFTGRKSF